MFAECCLKCNVDSTGSTVHLFVDFHAKAGVIGPYFIEEIEDSNDQRKTLTSSRYICMLENDVIPELKRRLGQSFEDCWFQQDGAPCHTAASSTEYLKSVFGHRLISNKTDFIWPPYSPDMSPLDYWFWSTLRLLIGKQSPQTKEEVQQYACICCLEITREQVAKAISDFPRRVIALQQAQGAHFEPMFKKSKRIAKQRAVTCSFCDEQHACDCQLCDDLCMAHVLKGLAVGDPIDHDRGGEEEEDSQSDQDMSTQ